MSQGKTVSMFCSCLLVSISWLLVAGHRSAETNGLIFEPPSQNASLIINEYLADPAQGSAGDANGDGMRDSNNVQDEFVELINTGSAALNASGFTISDSAQVRFTIAAGIIIPPGEALVVFGGGNPTGSFGNAAANGLVFAIGGAGLSLNNSGDSIIIKNSSGAEVARHDYPPPNSDRDQAITRSPDITGSFVNHLEAAGSGGRRFSPGALVNGRPFTSTDPLIASISPDSVTVGSGVVTVSVIGDNFQMGSAARIDGANVATFFISQNRLSAEVPPSVSARPGAYALTVQNPDASLSNAIAFTVLSAVGINEFLADPPDGIEGDANGDGTRDSSQDEFIEIVNRTDAQIDVGDFTISDGAQARFTFPPGTTIPAREAALVFGGGAPTGDFGNSAVNGLVFAASLSLNNGGDVITLKDSQGVLVESILYGSAEGNANQSINRNPDVTGASFALHATITGSSGLFSPGSSVSGSRFTVGPRIAQINPDSAMQSDAPFNITIQGSGFDTRATAFINSVPVPTELVSASLLTAIVPAGVAARAGDHRVEVRNAGGNRSNIVALRIIAPPPQLLSALPKLIQVGAGSFSIFLTGANFDSTSVVFVDGSAVATFFTNARELRAIAPASFAATVGTRVLRVRNGDGQQSNELAFEVINRASRITSLSPSEIIAGSPPFTLTVTGSGFRSDVTIFFNQTPLDTKLVSATVMQAEVPASLIASPGLGAISIQSADSLSSNEAVFRVLPIAPIIHSVEPGAVIEGSGDVRIALLGEKFQRGAALRLAAQQSAAPELVTDFITSERLEAQLPSRFTEEAGSLSLVVINPDFGISNSATLKVLIKDPLVINEFLADPPEGIAGDANGDGERSTSQDEFVEIVNRTSGAIDLSGYKLSDSEAARHVFAHGIILPPFEAAVVFGGGTPAGSFGNAAENKLVFKASSGALSLNNGGDSIKLEDASGRIVQQVRFGSAEGNANQSINRDPDIDGAVFSPHTSVAANQIRLFSPGLKATGETFTIKPLIRALEPSSVRAGSPAFALTVSGANFLPGASVLFNQTPVPTIYRSEGALEAQVSASLVAEGGPVDVQVRNPKGEPSTSATLLVVDDPPRIASMTPQQTATGAEDLEIIIRGERFQPAAVVTINGEVIETSFITPASLAGVASNKFFTRATELEVRVINADGNLSNAVTLVVENGPLITRLSRSRIKAGRGAVEITVGGLAFKQGVALFIDDRAVAISDVSETGFRASLPAELTARPGKLTLQARNLDGGRSNKAIIKVVE